MTPILDQADVVVVGAGIAGSTTAFELKARGFDVIVVEQRFPAYGASGRAAGAIWLQTCSAGTQLDLARAGRDKYQWYIDRVGNTFDYHQRGGLFFFETEAQGSVMERYVDDRRKAGLDVQMLTIQEAKSNFSLVPGTAIGAVYCADDAQVDVQKFVSAVSGASARDGVRVYENTAVLSPIRRDGVLTGLRTVRGDIHSPNIVWATGAWALNLTTEGIELPISTARQGQLLTQSIKPTQGPIMRGPRGSMWASALTELPEYFEKDFHEGQHGKINNDDTIVQRGEGGLLIGSSIDEPGALNPHIGIAASSMMLGNGLERYPQYASLGIVGLWAGVTSWTEDHLPIIDRYDGAYLNVGHARGVATGPIGGEIMADVMSSGMGTSDLARHLRFDRFR
jgi:glycine/D-amino acid oxidase-like deaminating enzyme